MSVSRIEKIEAGVVVQRAEPAARTGKFVCHPDGQNKQRVEFVSLDDVAGYLRANPGAGVRMNPGWSKVSEKIYVDGVKL